MDLQEVLRSWPSRSPKARTNFFFFFFFFCLEFLILVFFGFGQKWLFLGGGGRGGDGGRKGDGGGGGDWPFVGMLLGHFQN